MNIPVSFELANLLQDKKINIYSEYRYTDFNGIERLEKDASDIFPYAPTISDVVMWLYKNHKIWISVDPEIDTNTWFHTITHGKSITAFGNYSGPIEAYEKGFEHILNDMI